MEVTKNILYVGVDDTTIDLFESQYPMEEEIGVSYNSYVILDDKIAIMDAVDKRGEEEWFANLKKALGGKTPDYLVVQHLEPDHSGCVQKLVEKYPSVQVVCSAKAKPMLPQFFDFDMTNVLGVAEGDTLELGSHTLHFVMAPMVHWPEVMVTYESSEKILFSADGFGTFGAIKNQIPWEQEASHYFLNIVGKYGASVQALLKKAATLEIDKICPLHGPVLSGDLTPYLEKYQIWSSYEPEIDGILVCHASAHGNTKKAAEDFAEELKASGAKVKVLDLCREDVSEAVEKCFQYKKIVLAAITYDGNLFPAMQDLIYHLSIKNFQNRTIGLIENGSWAPVSGKKMREQLEAMKNVTVLDEQVTLKTKAHEENKAQFEALKKALLA